MKKFLFLLLAMSLFGSEAHAKHHCECDKCSGNEYKMSRGGFNDMAVMPMSIAQVMEQPKNTNVTMRGYITKRLGDDKYNFSDGTDNIVIEVDDKIWRGQVVSPKEQVVIWGELDKDDGKMMVEVKSLSIVK